MADDRPARPFNFRDRDRPGGGPRPPMRPGGPPRTGFSGVRPGPGPGAEGQASVRLRDGEREVEIHGSPGFCRMLLDDIPALLARLRGETAPRASIALPPPSAAAPERERSAGQDGVTPPPAAAPAPVAITAPGVPAVEIAAAPAPAPAAAANGGDDGTAGAGLDAIVLGELRGAGRALTIAELRRLLPNDTTGQAVRRVLERAGRTVVNVGGRPAAYRAR